MNLGTDEMHSNRALKNKNMRLTNLKVRKIAQNHKETCMKKALKAYKMISWKRKMRLILKRVRLVKRRKSRESYKLNKWLFFESRQISKDSFKNANRTLRIIITNSRVLARKKMSLNSK